MASKEVRNMSKSDWQEIAKEHKVKFTDKNTVRYLTEKVAEKIGVDDKIVDLLELKQAVCDKLASLKKEAVKKVAPKKETAKKAPAKKETAKKEAKAPATEKKKSTKGSGKKSETKAKAKKEALTPEKAEELRKTHYIKEALRLGANYGATQTSKDIKSILDLFCKQNEGSTYTPYANDKMLSKKEKVTAPDAKNSGKSKLQLLQDECTSLGVGFSPAHTEGDLEQLINAVKSAGVTPVVGGEKSLEQESFELDADNIDDIQKNAPNAETAPVEQQPIIQPEVGSPAVGLPAHQQALFEPAPADVTKVDEGQLIVYRNVFVGTIRNHFRLMSRGEIADLFKQANYPFTHVIQNHPEQGNKIEIILTSDGKSIRVPSDNMDEWIDING